ncbi:MAG: relaxase/mobilization nuclease and DUF3363 domain-containing protein [Xanthomonadaceae bacterium]|nr:relaxase/mobilization nuclease and DUF3363 domain-containing protein [Xanthomonadaceae bacterium]
MASRRGTQDGEGFRARPGATKAHSGPSSKRFIAQVLKAVSKSGAKASGAKCTRPASTFARGRVAAGVAVNKLGSNARRVVIKSRFVVLKKAGVQSVATHLRYIEREGTTCDGQRGQAYGADTDVADLKDFEDRGRGDRHQFRFIVSVEDAVELEELRGYTRELMARMEVDLETRLDWVAVDHWDTDNPHTHIALRGKVGQGRGSRDLVIAPDYMAHGMRLRASALATEWLGPRTELEIQQAQRREVEQERWTNLDRTLQRETVDGRLDVARLHESRLQRQRELLMGRLQRLQRMGLADQVDPGTWSFSADAEKTLRALGERGDIVRTMHRALKDEQRELVVFEPGRGDQVVVGRVAGKGLSGASHDRGYLVVDGIDGRAHYVALNAHANLEDYPAGAVVEVRGLSKLRVADQNIAALAREGLYRTDHHLAVARSQATAGRDPQEFVQAHVRRLEALRRVGVVDRVTEGLWKVPNDLVERGRRSDADRSGGIVVQLKSHWPIERQVRAIGATWLDQQLIAGGECVGDVGFGREAYSAMRKRADFLVEQGLAERNGRQLILALNLLRTLQNSELAQAARDIAAETGLEHRPVADGQRLKGIYRHSIALASGRYALIDDVAGFSLVPWISALDSKIGRTVVASMRDGHVSWEFGRQRC